ncbi:MAG: N4-(beta-N-acetylglucosaminyl)-L-asparaginase [Flavobacteriales bacterium]|jgi:N4-(beta-N-acetylglucosaminyl)-L-asparaginase
MSNRRSFLQKLSASVAAIGLIPLTSFASTSLKRKGARYKKGLVISTWNHGIPANATAWEIISNGGTAVDAAEMGARRVEEDPTGQSVGIGGMPDRDGTVTLDACIMDSKGKAGAVAYLEDILHPISVARKVMDETPHVMLAGDGAKRFALESGFTTTNLLTESSRKAWLKWSKEANYKPVINIENHDTIGLISMDKNGDLAGSCTTSGVAFKMKGRVGDSPIIGAGLFVDNEVGAATATGMGEFVMRTLGSFLIVELMRQGATPQEACEEGIRRIVAGYDVSQIQVGYLATDTEGNIGAYAIHPGFNYAIYKDGKNIMIDSPSHL